MEEIMQIPHSHRQLQIERELLQSIFFLKDTIGELKKENVKLVNSITVRCMDLLGGCFVSQKHLIVTSSCFNVRYAFEFFVNAEYISLHIEEDKGLYERFINYHRYKTLCFTVKRKKKGSSPPEHYDIEKEEENLKVDFPCFFDEEGSLKKNYHWTEKSKNKSMHNLIDAISSKNPSLKDTLETDKIQYYQTISDVIHNSTLIINLFTTPANPSQQAGAVSFYNTRAAIYMLKGLVKYYKAAGVLIDEARACQLIKSLDNAALKAPPPSGYKKGG